MHAYARTVSPSTSRAPLSTLMVTGRDSEEKIIRVVKEQARTVYTSNGNTKTQKLRSCTSCSFFYRALSIRDMYTVIVYGAYTLYRAGRGTGVEETVGTGPTHGHGSVFCRPSTLEGEMFDGRDVVEVPLQERHVCRGGDQSVVVPAVRYRQRNLEVSLKFCARLGRKTCSSQVKLDASGRGLLPLPGRVQCIFMNTHELLSYFILFKLASVSIGDLFQKYCFV